MIEIGEKPIIWHIMKIYSSHGINDFIICLGYKGYLIKEYFINYYKHMSDLTIDLSNNNVKIHNNYSESWKITLVNTGEDSMTGGRIRRISEYVKNDDFFVLHMEMDYQMAKKLDTRSCQFWQETLRMRADVLLSEPVN